MNYWGIFFIGYITFLVIAMMVLTAYVESKDRKKIKKKTRKKLKKHLTA